MLDESNKEIEKILVNDNSNIEQMEVDEHNESYTTIEKIIYILKGISSIISGIIHNFGFFSIFALGYTTIYLISFRRYYNQNLEFSHSYCIMPLINLTVCLTGPLAGIIEDRFGGKLTIFISNLILCISFSILYYSRSIYIDYFLMCLNGIGIGIGINITKKNACSFFMNRKCLIIGIINLIPSLLSFALIFYNETDILNYAGEPPSIEETFYRKKVFINYQKLIIFEIKILIFTCLWTILLYFENNPEETTKFGFNEKVQNDNNKNNNEIKPIHNKKKTTKKEKIRKALYNKRTIKLIIMVFFFLPKVNLIHNSLRMDITLHFLYALLYSIVGSISSLIFTIIGDFIQFRILFVFLSLLLSGSSFVLVYYLNEGFVLFLETIFVSFIFNGFNIIFDSHIMKVYGIENYIYILGIIRLSGGLSEICGIIFKFGLNYETYGYKIVYFTTGSFGLFSLGIGLFECENKYDYDN